MFRLSLFLATLLSTIVGSPVAAQDLTLRWLGASGAVLAEKLMSVEDIEALEQQVIVTHTPWEAGNQTFSGPLLATLADLAGLPVVEAALVALNDYSAEIPQSDWALYDVIMAVRHDGEEMRIRDKGPFRIVYPVDAYPELASHLYHSRMIWQIRSIDFRVE
ncbi:molybdopterin-dependent oxidoreductase [Afifella sp. H1R]|uniref:molybdopterin-dependent oxidoreductase n=2 Tax=unclassified Afifella TaxID=2624128 RepID=UPI001F433754|nr:molybdopterin-dependent oxidoreductase [Afifella sp. H1R]MCF1503772.1 molybdopterin-dependent oxidoreductase [Afifella sp. H1R]